MKRILPYITNFILILSLLLGSIYYVTVDTSFYEKQYEKNGTADHIGISQKDLMSATNVVVDYLKGDIENMEIKAEVKGVTREIFDQREKDHMVDVKVLFEILEKTFITLVILGIILIGINIAIYKKQGIRNVAKAFIPTALCFAIVVVVLGAIFIWNFNWFWTNFHLLIFTNDLWLLDPKISIMINMFPLNFFYACCFKILSIFVGDILLLGLMSYTIKNKFAKI